MEHIPRQDIGEVYADHERNGRGQDDFLEMSEQEPHFIFHGDTSLTFDR